jgi:hypothetical protein
MMRRPSFIYEATARKRPIIQFDSDVRIAAALFFEEGNKNISLMLQIERTFRWKKCRASAYPLLFCGDKQLYFKKKELIDRNSKCNQLQSIHQIDVWKEVFRIMKKTAILTALSVMLLSAGCATQSQFLDSKQAMATNTALENAKFKMNCQNVTPMIISREVVQPALQGPWVGGIQRAEYTIGVTGCGKRSTFIVICPEGGEGCFAAGPGRFHNWQ